MDSLSELDSLSRTRRVDELTTSSHFKGLVVPLLVAAVDCLIIFDSFSLAYLLRFRWQIAFSYAEPAPPGAYLKAMAVVAYFWILLFRVYGLYDFSRRRSNIDTVQALVKAITYGTLIILSITYFYREVSFSRLACVYAWCISLGLFVCFRISLNLLRDHYHRRGASTRRVLLIGGRSLAAFLVEKIRARPELGYRVVGALDDDVSPLPLGCDLLGSVEDLETVLRGQDVHRVFIADPVLDHTRLLEVIDICERLDVKLAMVPPTYDLTINHRDFEEVDGVPLVSVNEKEVRRVREIAKRVFDVVGGSFLLVLLSPFCLLATLLIKMEDGGDVIFTQRRVGKDGRVFPMLKFRTMVANAEGMLPGLVDLDRLGEPVFKLDEDPRVTRVGRFLRRTSLDEVPQLLNVLGGHMSLVGPRPEEEMVVARYDVWQRRRLKAKPGITGLQQVECRGSTDLRERVRWDTVYLRKQTFCLDLWIVLKTAWVVLGGKGAR